jgi:GntR family transcriptional repressor for pyruvate dehydrogenase complex
MKKKIQIKPVQRESMVDQVENNLRAYIKERGFKPGDTLPTESELANSMNVSRNVIREALSRFKMLGLISSNKKNGIRLIKFELFPALERIFDPTVLDQSTLHELFELRIMLEIGMADALFRHKSLEQIQELKKIVSECKEKCDPENKIEYEIRFHSSLYKISKNETLYGFQKYLKIVFDYVIELETKAGMEEVPPPKISHLQLVECLESGTVEQFRQLMYDHFSTYSEMDIFKRNG